MKGHRRTDGWVSLISLLYFSLWYQSADYGALKVKAPKQASEATERSGHSSRFLSYIFAFLPRAALDTASGSSPRVPRHDLSRST